MKQDNFLKVSSFKTFTNNSVIAKKCVVDFFTSKQQIFFSSKNAERIFATTTVL